jgi:hypothetical protein
MFALAILRASQFSGIEGIDIAIYELAADTVEYGARLSTLHNHDCFSFVSALTLGVARAEPFI